MLAKQDLYTNLFNEHRNQVYQQVYAMTRSAWCAEEIVQEVFIKVWMHIDKIETINNFEGWLNTITKRKVYDLNLKLKNQYKLLAGYKGNGKITQIDDHTLSVRCMHLLQQAESRLPPRKRMVFHLKHWKGMNKVQIAKLLNISEHTVVHHIKSSANIVRDHILQYIEMGPHKVA